MSCVSCVSVDILCLRCAAELGGPVYLIPTTIHSEGVSRSTRVVLKPASRIQVSHSAPGEAEALARHQEHVEAHEQPEGVVAGGRRR